MDYISATERATLKSAFNVSSSKVSFQPTLLNDLITTLSRFGCQQVPTSSLLSSMVVQAASCEFYVKPATALSLLYSGIPSVHKGFWEKNLLMIYMPYTVNSVLLLESYSHA